MQHSEVNSMNKQRIQVYADSEIKRRIELAAAKYNMPVTEYCLQAITQQLVDDDLFEQIKIEIAIQPTISTQLVSELQDLQQRILARRGGKLLDLDNILAEAREERDDEILGLR